MFLARLCCKREVWKATREELGAHLHVPVSHESHDYHQHIDVHGADAVTSSLEVSYLWVVIRVFAKAGDDITTAASLTNHAGTTLALRQLIPRP